MINGTHESGACPRDAEYREPVSLSVGESLHPEVASGARAVISVPAHDDLEKCESRVVAWRGGLADGTRAFFKLYTHRPARRITHGVRTQLRVCREFNGLSRLEESGVRCTPPLYWGHGRSDLLGHVELLVTALVEGAEPLRRALQARAALADELDWKALLASVEAMHEAGVHHGGLSAKNILLDSRQRFVLCDLAKSMCYPTALGGTRMAFFDLVHLFAGLSKLVGSDRCEQILADGSGDPVLAERVMAKAARYHRRRRVQRKLLRAEFHARNLWAWHGAPVRARMLGGSSPESRS